MQLSAACRNLEMVTRSLTFYWCLFSRKVVVQLSEPAFSTASQNLDFFRSWGHYHSFDSLDYEAWLIYETLTGSAQIRESTRASASSSHGLQRLKYEKDLLFLTLSGPPRTWFSIREEIEIRFTTFVNSNSILIINSQNDPRKFTSPSLALRRCIPYHSYTWHAVFK
jgi:hypothetical protein